MSGKKFAKRYSKPLCLIMVVLLAAAMFPALPVKAADIVLQAEDYDSMNGITNFGTVIGNCDGGDWVCFNNVDLGSGYNTLIVKLAVPPEHAGNTLEVRLDSLTGTLVGTLTTTSTGDWSVFQEQSTTLTDASGIHNVYFCFAGPGTVGNFDYFRFSGETSETGTGLKGEYFDNKDLTNLKVTRTDETVNFNWGTGSPAPSVGADTFSVRWSGQVKPEYSETYTFHTYTDDGVRLWVNGQKLIDRWFDQGPTEWSGSIALTAGQKYDICMEYYENGEGAVAKLYWSSASQQKEIIPQDCLFVPQTAPTPTPTPTPPSYILLQAESYNTMQGITNYGTVIGSCDPGDWVCFKNVDLASGYASLTARLAVPPENAGNRLEVRLGSTTGTLIGTLTAASTGDWGNYQEQSTVLTGGSGIHDIYFYFAGPGTVGNFDWFKLVAGSMPTATPTPTASPTPTPTTTPPQGAIYNVTDYGPLYAGESITEAQKWANTNTIQTAINVAGQNGGGTVVIPAGYYCITANAGSTCLVIRYNNITLKGAGKYQTTLRTRSHYEVISNEVRRAHGIIIEGTTDPQNPRRNITLRDFELDGGAGWTGKYHWPADTATGDGWDITHKGIVPGWDRCVDNITLENIYVHSYRGEVIYTGGLGAGKLTLRNVRSEDTNGSCFNAYGAEVLIENCEFGGPSRFWMELTARVNQLGYPKNEMIIRNCTFRDAYKPMAICQGDLRNYSFRFENNTFENAPGLFHFYSGVGGPVTITGNQITNCGSILFFEWGGGTTNPPNNHINRNILFENNTINSSSGPLIGITGNWDGEPLIVENVTVRNNIFRGKNPADPSESDAVVEYGEVVSWWNGEIAEVEINNVVISNNSFHDVKCPAQVGQVNAGNRPLFSNNTYNNVLFTEGNGTFNITSSSRTVTPQFEEVRIYADSPNIVPTLTTTGGYPDGQTLKATGGSSGKPVKFAAGSSSYHVAQDRYLNGSNALYFRFDSAQGKWIEY